MHLYIHVEIGNAAMISGPDVIKALVRNRLNAGSDEPLRTGESGKIFDDNGNCVGAWHVQEEPQT